MIYRRRRKPWISRRTVSYNVSGRSIAWRILAMRRSPIIIKLMINSWSEVGGSLCPQLTGDSCSVYRNKSSRASLQLRHDPFFGHGDRPVPPRKVPISKITFNNAISIIKSFVIIPKWIVRSIRIPSCYKRKKTNRYHT